jgi:hypothetical protein
MEQNQVFNYVDSLQSAAQKQYFSNIHDTAILQTGRRAFIYPLDKKLTKTDVYNNTLNRVYLPHFELRALYKTNAFVPNLSLDGMYQEKEENMEFIFNFERMVNTIRDLKDSISGTFKIRNVSKEEMLIEISNGVFKATTPLGVVIFSEKLEDYSSVRLLIDSISEQTDFIRLEYDGNSEPASSINNFHTILKKGNTFEVNVDNSIYKNISDVIEAGFVIITDRARVYSVVSAVPENDSYGNEYIGWKCMGKLENLAVVDTLPNDAKQLVQKLTYGLSKIKME